MRRWKPVFGNRLYLMMWTSQAISLIGDVTYRLAIIVHVYNISGSALQVGTLMMFTVLPSLVFGSVAGVFIDRWRLKRILVVSDVLRGLAVVGILFSTSLWQIYALTFLINSASRFFQPTYAVAVASVVHRQHLQATNSFNSTTRRTIQLVFPAVAGVVIGILGLDVAFILNAGSYTMSVLVLALINLPERDRAKQQSTSHSFRFQWLEGYSWVRRTPAVWALTITAAILGFPVGVNNALMVVFVEQVLQMQVIELGYLMSALTAGILAGGIVFGILHSGNRHAVTALGLALAGAGFLAFAFNNNLVIALGLRFIVGFGFSLFNISAFTTLQELAPAGLRGRVFTFFTTVDETAALIFLGLAGLMADLVGIISIFAMAGVVVMAGALQLHCSLRGAHPRRDQSGLPNPG